MGREASHLTLEVALQCQPNMTLISEEIREKQISLEQIVKDIADLVEQRAAEGKRHGVVLLPEGLIDFIPEFKPLIAEINEVLAKKVEAERLLGLSVQMELERRKKAGLYAGKFEAQY